MEVDDNKYFGICKCCLSDGCFRSMWVDYKEGGVVQNYGTMLNECFDLCWPKPNNELVEQICDDCVSRTRQTYKFRRLVLESQDRLNGVVKPKDSTYMVEVEVDLLCSETVDCDVLSSTVKEDITEVDSEDNSQDTYEYDAEYLEDVSAEIYEDIEYLEPEVENQQEKSVARPKRKSPKKLKRGEKRTYKNYSKEDFERSMEAVRSNTMTAAEASRKYNVPRKTLNWKILDEKRKEIIPEIIPEITEAPPKRKWPKKKKRGEKKRLYKNYSLDDVKESMEAVKSKTMSVAEASAKFNIPRKTLTAKILSEKRGEIPKIVTNERYIKFIKEIKTLLTYTNMLPYKSKTAHLHCAYCSTLGPLFEDPDELRRHTRTQHAGERTRSVDQFLRPFWLNEVLKVDIENLHCTICCTFMVSWNDMFKHLTEQHDLEFDEAYTRVIPYVLNSDLRCALCKDSFPNYHHLDCHMNAHYSNYMCSECGETFVAESRLKKHLLIHDTGRYQCEQCGKTFTRQKYKVKHIELVHHQNEKVKCLYCPAKFHGTYQRHHHVVECHKEKVKVITCDMCGKTFDWRPYYLAHMRRKHNDEKNYKCKSCPKKFFMKSELSRHQAKHTGAKFACDICGKQYSTKWVLNMHYRSHGVEKGRPRLKNVSSDS